MTPTDLLAPTYTQMLTALSNWLGKAEAQISSDAEALLSARLADDMFPLATQIRFACVQAQEGMCRLLGRDFPPSVAQMLEEGRNAGEKPGSLADAKARIADTVAFVNALASEPVQTSDDTKIAHALPTGMVFDFTTGQYVRDWALAQFYFHLMAAYAILRSRGVELGKVDYVAHLLGHVRPGTMPQN